MKRLTLLILGGAMLSSAAFARDADSEFKAFMMATLPKLAKAFENKDMKWFDQISTADFTEKMGAMTMTKAQAMAEMKQEFASMKSMKCSFNLLSSKVKGNIGTALTHGTSTMVMMPQGKEKSHTMKIEMWGKETWVRAGKAWKIKTMEQDKPMKMWMDGKAVDPAKMMGNGK